MDLGHSTLRCGKREALKDDDDDEDDEDNDHDGDHLHLIIMVTVIFIFMGKKHNLPPLH